MSNSNSNTASVTKPEASPITALTKLPLVQAIQQAFESRRVRKTAGSNGLNMTFYVSNDLFSLAEVLPMLRENVEVKTAGNLVNILVAESDIFSIVHNLEGDIIIGDIDAALLDYIDDLIESQLELYKKYRDKELTFAGVLKSFSEFYRDLTIIRMETLGRHHFLFSEESYVRSMEALSRKQIVT